MHLKEENPHPRNEAKAVRVRGQVDKGMGGVEVMDGETPISA